MLMFHKFIISEPSSGNRQHLHFDAKRHFCGDGLLIRCVHQQRHVDHWCQSGHTAFGRHQLWRVVWRRANHWETGPPYPVSAGFIGHGFWHRVLRYRLMDYMAIVAYCRWSKMDSLCSTGCIDYLCVFLLVFERCCFDNCCWGVNLNPPPENQLKSRMCSHQL